MAKRKRGPDGRFLPSTGADTPDGGLGRLPTKTDLKLETARREARRRKEDREFARARAKQKREDAMWLKLQNKKRDEAIAKSKRLAADKQRRQVKTREGRDRRFDQEKERERVRTRESRPARVKPPNIGRRARGELAEHRRRVRAGTSKPGQHGGSVPTIPRTLQKPPVHRDTLNGGLGRDTPDGGLGRKAAKPKRRKFKETFKTPGFDLFESDRLARRGRLGERRTSRKTSSQKRGQGFL